MCPDETEVKHGFRLKLLWSVKLAWTLHFKLISYIVSELGQEMNACIWKCSKIFALHETGLMSLSRWDWFQGDFRCLLPSAFQYELFLWQVSKNNNYFHYSFIPRMIRDLKQNCEIYKNAQSSRMLQRHHGQVNLSCTDHPKRAKLQFCFWNRPNGYVILLSPTVPIEADLFYLGLPSLPTLSQPPPSLLPFPLFLSSFPVV